MSKWIMKFAYLPLLSLSFSSALAEEVESQYQQKNLPDGSVQMDYSQSDGSKIKQIRKPDGTIETHSIDADGNETMMTQHPNGDVEMNQKIKDPS